MPVAGRGGFGDAVMKRRMGLKGWAGSRPYTPWSKTLVTRTTGEGHNPGTTSGAVFGLPVNNWNDPLGALTTLVSGTGTIVQNRHPMHHDSAIEDGYNVVQVLLWSAKMTFNFIGAEAAVGDYLVAYHFGSQLASEVSLTAGAASRVERMELLTNPRWTVKHLNGSPQEIQDHTVRIAPINVFDYCEIIADGAQTVAFGNGLMSHGIRDVSFTSDFPVVELFCIVVIMTESGLEMPVDSVHATIEITQKVRIMRDNLGAEDMDEGEPDLHA